MRWNAKIFVYSDSDAVFQGMEISDEVLKELLSIIKRRMTPHPVKIRARKCIVCLGISGIPKINATLYIRT